MPTPESSMTPQQALELLQELRARLAAVERVIAPKLVRFKLPATSITVLVFTVNGADAAICVECVQEVVSYAQLTPLPESPGWIAGVLDLGGQTVCVIDVAARLLAQTHVPRLDDFIIICRIEDRPVGLVVESLRNVATFAPEAVVPPPSDAPSAPYLIATIRGADAPILLLGLEQLLHVTEFQRDMEEPWERTLPC